MIRLAALLALLLALPVHAFETQRGPARGGAFQASGDVLCIRL